jgi:hypothetical protein
MSRSELVPNSKWDAADSRAVDLQFGAAGQSAAARSPSAKDAHVQPLSEPLLRPDDAPVRRLTVVEDTEAVAATPVRLPAADAAALDTGAVRASSGKTCSCGHDKQAHLHYRAGSDCAVCGCGKYHRSLLSRLWALSR